MRAAAALTVLLCARGHTESPADAPTDAATDEAASKSACAIHCSALPCSLSLDTFDYALACSQAIHVFRATQPCGGMLEVEIGHKDTGEYYFYDAVTRGLVSSFRFGAGLDCRPPYVGTCTDQDFAPVDVCVRDAGGG